MLLLRREKTVFPHIRNPPSNPNNSFGMSGIPNRQSRIINLALDFVGSPAVAERTHNPAHHGEEGQTAPKRNTWRFRRTKEDWSAGGGRLKKSRARTRDNDEESEDGASAGEGEHGDPPDELEREMENESEVDVDVDKDGISFRMRETRRPHLKMVRQRHKQESHAGS